MNNLEKQCVQLRHHPFLKGLPIWDVVRPAYNTFMKLLASKNGLERILNGTDSLRLDPNWRQFQEIYEPLVWKHLMANVRRGDFVVDVGAFIGLYTIAMAKRVAPHGSVISFEPDPTNFKWLQRHIALNHVEDRVRLRRAALGHVVGRAYFEAGRDAESHISQASAGKIEVSLSTLDSEFSDQHIDLVKIDVEGVEENVLRGGIQLLRDPARCPRIIYIEVHPYAWEELGSSSKSLLGLLRDCNYRVSLLDGQPADRIDSYGEVVAHKI